MKTAAQTRAIMDALEAQHPGADTELHHTNAFELLIATILSAQSTDQRVNMVTPALFRKYPDAAALAKATPAKLEPMIRTTGFFRSKSKSIHGAARALVEMHNGEVPASMDALVALPGVGRKTANVVLGHALGVPNRIGIAESDHPEVVEQQLCAALPADRWTRTSDTLILHGRRICRPKPLCDACAVRDDCDYFRALQQEARAPRAANAKDPTKAKKKPPARKRRAS
jgi:endonuclease-3